MLDENTNTRFMIQRIKKWESKYHIEILTFFLTYFLQFLIRTI